MIKLTRDTKEAIALIATMAIFAYLFYKFYLPVRPNEVAKDSVVLIVWYIAFFFFMSYFSETYDRDTSEAGWYFSMFVMLICSGYFGINISQQLHEFYSYIDLVISFFILASPYFVYILLMKLLNKLFPIKKAD